MAKGLKMRSAGYKKRSTSVQVLHMAVSNPSDIAVYYRKLTGE